MRKRRNKGEEWENQRREIWREKFIEEKMKKRNGDRRKIRGKDWEIENKIMERNGIEVKMERGRNKEEE